MVQIVLLIVPAKLTGGQGSDFFDQLTIRICVDRNDLIAPVGKIHPVIGVLVLDIVEIVDDGGVSHFYRFGRLEIDMP